MFKTLGREMWEVICTHEEDGAANRGRAERQCLYRESSENLTVYNVVSTIVYSYTLIRS